MNLRGNHLPGPPAPACAAEDGRRPVALDARRVDARSRLARRVAGLVLCASLQVGPAAPVAPATNGPADFSVPLDAAFGAGLRAVREQLGLRDPRPGLVVTGWQADLCLLLGFRVDIGARQYVNLIELTTLPVERGAASSLGKSPPPAVMSMSCPADALISTSRVYRFTSPRYPVRVRVYDGQGAFLKESREYLPWSFLTNGLNRGCLARLTDTNAIPGPKAGAGSSDAAAAPAGAAARREAIERQLRKEHAILGSLTALVTLFSDTLAASSVEGVRAHAFDVVRKPSLLRVIADLGLHLRLEPQLDEAALLPPGTPHETEPRAWLPVELKQGGRLLLSVSFVTASTAGPHFLSGGIRAIRAVHPLKADRRLLAQVLAVGEITRPVAPGPPLRR